MKGFLWRQKLLVGIHALLTQMSLTSVKDASKGDKMTQSKAIVAGILTVLLSGATALATVLTGDATLNTLTQGQWLAVIISMLTSGAAVYGVTYAVTNAPARVDPVAPILTVGE